MSLSILKLQPASERASVARLSYLTICVGDVHAESSAGERHVVTMIATIAVLVGRAEREP